MDEFRESLLARLAALIEEHRDVRVTIPEDAGWLLVEEPTIARVRSFLDRSLRLVVAIGECYETEGGHLDAVDGRSEADFLRQIGAQISAELAAQEVAGLALVARSQILELQQALARATAERDVWKTASHADTALRRTYKALVALESTIREYEGLPGRRRRWERIEDSLAIRRLYARLRRAVVHTGEPRRAELHTRLRTLADRLAELRELDVYPLLRIDDRLEIRQLQRRIHQWFADPGDDAETAGRRLWQDLAGFAQLLSHVNLREELIEHDREVVTELWRRLFAVERPPREIGPRVRACLHSLEGRDDELDAIIQRLYAHEPEDLRQPLERLRRELVEPLSRRHLLLTPEVA